MPTAPDVTTASLDELERAHADVAASGLSLDLTRGKPGSDQLDLSDDLDGIIDGDWELDGVDTRNYGGLDGQPSSKALGARLLDMPAANVLVGGNSSLDLMGRYLLHAHVFGVRGGDTAWNRGTPKMLCPVPGYDRHFALTDHLGIEMLPVPMTETGPDMDRVEELVGNDDQVRGMWCVPKYSNPTGVTYDEATVRRIAELARIAGDHFRVFWDNAYAVHDLGEPDYLMSMFSAADTEGTQDSIVQFASTSKITHAGSGIAFLGTGMGNLAAFRDHLQYFTIGPDKVDHLRHVRKLGAPGAIRDHMAAHAELIRPKFAAVTSALQEGLGTDDTLGRWTDPDGGYFISFWTRPGLATEVVALAADAGVALTPAGAAFPYGDDPEDRHIRLAPTYPSLADVERAMEVFVLCVRLATARAMGGDDPDTD